VRQLSGVREYRGAGARLLDDGHNGIVVDLFLRGRRAVDLQRSGASAPRAASARVPQSLRSPAPSAPGRRCRCGQAACRRCAATQQPARRGGRGASAFKLTGWRFLSAPLGRASRSASLHLMACGMRCLISSAFCGLARAAWRVRPARTSTGLAGRLSRRRAAAARARAAPAAQQHLHVHLAALVGGGGLARRERAGTGSHGWASELGARGSDDGATRRAGGTARRARAARGAGADGRRSGGAVPKCDRSGRQTDAWC